MVKAKGKKRAEKRRKPPRRRSSDTAPHPQLMWGLSALVVALIGVAVGLYATNQRPSEQYVREPDFSCENEHDDIECTKFAKAGECERNPGWMAVKCARACGDCSLLNPGVRCTPENTNMSTVPGLKPGGINRMFERWFQDPAYAKYSPEIITRPPEGPWVVMLHNFVSDEEIDAVLSKSGTLKRSTDQGAFNEHGVQDQVVSSTRTSTNAWCTHACASDPHVKSLVKRIEGVTGIPKRNYESFQVLRYEPGQYYRRHHDTSLGDFQLLSGPRVLTFFLYFNDVEAGGGTEFTDLGITVNPRKGSALVWPSVTDDLDDIDMRAHHAALEVKKGVKYGANSWIHLYDYETPNLWGCTGSFA